MRGLIQSMIGASGAAAAFSVEQTIRVLRWAAGGDGDRGAEEGFRTVSEEMERQLPPVLRETFAAGNRIQERTVDTLFDALPDEPRKPGDWLRLPAVALDFMRATRQVIPSSTALASAMARPLAADSARTVVELGPGTGVMTRQLLRRLAPEARLLAFEIHPPFVELLRKRFPDPRLEVLPMAAEEAGDELRRRGIAQVGGVASSLGLTVMPEAAREEVFRGLLPLLAPGAVWTQFQYLNFLRVSKSGVEIYDGKRYLERHFHEVRRRVVWRNVPPVFVYECRRPRAVPLAAGSN